MSKKKIILRSILGCLGFIGVIIVIVIFIVIFAVRDVTEKQFTTLDTVPSKVSTSQQEYTQIPQGTAIIEGLAYIKSRTSTYTDDADPEADGISIDISFYDNKSENLNFHDILIKVQIELYGYRDVLDDLNGENAELIYRGFISVDHSMRLGELLGHYIRIPFEEIALDRNKYNKFGSIKVIIETPEQGIFSDTPNFPVSLYPSQ